MAILGRLSRPPLQRKPHDLADFINTYIRGEDDIAVAVIGVLCTTAGGGLALDVAYLVGASMLTCIALGMITAWVVASGIISYAYIGARVQEGSSLVCLPWRQRWTWCFLIITAPWSPLWGLSKLRLTAVEWAERGDK